MPADPQVSVIVPAWNEERLISETLCSIKSAINQWQGRPSVELIVVDDGSRDATYAEAARWSDLIVQHPKRCGKGAALATGKHAAQGSLLVFLDADLGSTARWFPQMVAPILDGEADMVIAQFAAVHKPGGFGLVKKLAKRGVYRLSGFTSSAPLSGQRAIRREVLNRIGRLSDGFGVEVGLTIDAVKLGFIVREQTVPFAHRESGRDMQDWLHRAKQFYAVGGTLWRCWRQPIC
jgi:glycosyltransferase involved in cell wall biosynthesis